MLESWDSWDSLERWWQKYGHATTRTKLKTFFAEEIGKTELFLLGKNGK